MFRFGVPQQPDPVVVEQVGSMMVGHVGLCVEGVLARGVYFADDVAPSFIALGFYFLQPAISRQFLLQDADAFVSPVFVLLLFGFVNPFFLIEFIAVIAQLNLETDVCKELLVVDVL